MRLAFVMKRVARLCQREIDIRSFSSTNSLSANTIGFIGLGNMGLPMSLNLAKGNRVVAFDTNLKAMSIAEESGIQRASSIEEIGASECSIIFTMLPGCNVVNDVTRALLDSDTGNSYTIFVDCSTVRA